MIHIVEVDNCHLYTRELDEMHRLRARFFCETLGWSALTVVEGREVDAYDDELAIYLLAIEDDGEISVSVRPRPTFDRSLLLDHFPHLSAEEPSRVARAGVWESCRYFATPRVRGVEGAKRREELRLAMVELAHERGIERIVAITDTVFLPPLLQSSWTTRLMGLPAPYAEGECIALEIACSAEALLRMQERLSHSIPTLLKYEDREASLGLRPHEFAKVLQGAPSVPKSEVYDLIAILDGLSTRDIQTIARVLEQVAREGDGSGERLVSAIIATAQGCVPENNSRTLHEKQL